MKGCPTYQSQMYGGPSGYLVPGNFRSMSPECGMQGLQVKISNSTSTLLHVVKPTNVPIKTSKPAHCFDKAPLSMGHNYCSGKGTIPIFSLFQKQKDAFTFLSSGRPSGLCDGHTTLPIQCPIFWSVQCILSLH